LFFHDFTEIAISNIIFAILTPRLCALLLGNYVLNVRFPLGIFAIKSLATKSFRKPKTNRRVIKKLAKVGRKPTVDRSYAEDEYVEKWLVGLADSTKNDYVKNFKEWLDFIEMTPTEQINRRIADLTNTMMFSHKPSIS